MNDKKRKPDFDDFRLWLTTLEMGNPVLHVNGPLYSTAVITVDFGTPLEEQKLTPEQNAELIIRIRNATKSLVNSDDSNIRVQNDSNNGIWWASVG